MPPGPVGNTNRHKDRAVERRLSNLCDQQRQPNGVSGNKQASTWNNTHEQDLYFGQQPRSRANLKSRFRKIPAARGARSARSRSARRPSKRSSRARSGKGVTVPVGGVDQRPIRAADPPRPSRWQSRSANSRPSPITRIVAPMIRSLPCTTPAACGTDLIAVPRSVDSGWDYNATFNTLIMYGTSRTGGVRHDHRFVPILDAERDAA